MEEKKIEINDSEEVVDEFEIEDDFQVTRREFFSHTFDPAVSFKYDSITFNTAALNRIVDADYILVMINPKEKRMVIKACDADSPCAIKWCRRKKDTNQRMPRKVMCKLFAAKMFDMMGWVPENKYKIQAQVIRTPEEVFLIFNLEDTEVYVPKEVGDDGIIKNSKPFYPEDWKNSFGLPYSEHDKLVKIEYLDEYARMEVVKKMSRKPKQPKRFDVIPEADVTVESILEHAEGTTDAGSKSTLPGTDSK